MIIEGIILIVLAVLVLAIWLISEKLVMANGAGSIDGEIVSSDLQRKEVVIRYTVSGSEYSSAYNCAVYADLGEMPPVGLKVRIYVDPNQPEKIAHMQLLREMGRGIGMENKYTDNSSGKRRFTFIAMSAMLLLGGVYCILQGASVI